MERTVKRRIYTKQIKSFFGTNMVKVITGIRRSGKSEIMRLLIDEALKITNKNHVIYINFEEMRFDKIKSYTALNDYIENKIKDNDKYYIFIDEIQIVDGWEKTVNSLRLKNTDIYVTGSNANLLSGELATLLAGRYVSFEVHPLSFEEFMQFRNEFGLNKGSDTSQELKEYIKIGGFPFLSTAKLTDNQIRKILIDLQSAIVLKDVVARNKIKNTPLLERIIKFFYDNVGKLITLTNIVNYMKSNGGEGDMKTVSSYVSALENAFIIRKVQRYDLRGKKLLETNDKYYLADHSLQYAVMDMRTTNQAGILENIVFCELIRRGYNVYVGKSDLKEIDFVAEKINGGDKVYVQVCKEFSTQEVIDREYAPLIEIKDHYPKYVVSLDDFANDNIEGVRGIHLKDFLLLKSF